MPRKTPNITVRLPFHLVDRGWDMVRVVGRGRLGRFALSGPERAFARRLLCERRNLWLYRTDQRAFCGDFLVVDMSDPRPPLRQAWAIELKRRARLRRGIAGMQLAGWRAAHDEVATRDGIVVPGGATDLLIGAAQDCFAAVSPLR